jgi:hypothetical protein
MPTSSPGLMRIHVLKLSQLRGRILAVDTNQKIISLAGPKTKRIDVGGRLVVPSVCLDLDYLRNGIEWNIGRHTALVFPESVPEMTHHMFYEQPEKCRNVIFEFLRES